MSDAKLKDRYRAHVFICQGKSCTERSSPGAMPEDAKKYFKDKIKELGLKEEVRACTSSCLDLCDQGPNIVVYPEGRWYSGVSAAEWEAIFKRHVAKDQKQS